MENVKEALNSKQQPVESHSLLVKPQAGRLATWVLWISMAASFYVLGLCSFTISVYEIAASSKFNSLVQYSTLGTVDSIIMAVGNAPLAKLADIVGRPFSWVIGVLFYMLGTILMGAATSFGTLAAGNIFYAIGYTSITLLQQLALADLIVPTKRTLAVNLLNFHYLINFAVAGKVDSAVSWRWGISMFSILIPIINLPIIAVLYYEHLQKPFKGWQRLLNVPRWTSAKDLLIGFDWLGFFLMTAGFALLLVPLTIADTAPHGYHTGYIIAMLALGAVFLIAWPFAEFKAPNPMINIREFIFNADVMLPVMIYGVDQMSTTISYQNVYEWVEITFGFSTQNATYFYYTQSLSNVVFGIICSYIAMRTHRYKWLAFAGGILRVVGLALMYHYRNRHSSVAQIVIPQIVQGIGGGMLTANLATAAQQAVSHSRVAIVTAFILLVGNLGTSIGSAITGAVEQNVLHQLHHLVDPVAGNSTVADEVYGGGASVAEEYPLGSPIRNAISDAWSENMRQLLVRALISGVINLLMCLPMPDRMLSDRTQNSVTEEPIGLEIIDPETSHSGTTIALHS